MSPYQKMSEFMEMDVYEQMENKDEILETLEEFLRTAPIEDIDILNHDRKKIGLHLSAEHIMLLGAYGNRFYNK
jgi:hypothetical protein